MRQNSQLTNKYEKRASIDMSSPKFQKFKKKAKRFFVNLKNEFIKNKNIVERLVIRNIKVQYRNSAIGILWTILNPLLNMLVMYLVFGTIFGYEGPSYILYLLCGNIMFHTLRGATQQSLPSLVKNRGLLTKNKIAYQVFPLSLNISAIVNFLFSYVALLIVMFFVNVSTPYMNPFSPSMLKVILMLPAFFLFIYGVSLILSAAYVYFRDILHFYTIFLTLWTYMTPIFYMTDRVGHGFLAQVFNIVLKLNPMVRFTEYFRNITYRNASLASSDAWYVPEIQRSIIRAVDPTLGSLYGIGLSFFIIGTLIFTLTKRNFIYKI